MSSFSCIVCGANVFQASSGVPCIRKCKVHSRTSGCLPVQFVSCQKHI
jgi:hypothetical protein